VSVRAGPDLSSFGSSLPDFDELLPEELRYLRDVCRALRKLGFEISEDQNELEARFDRDELGIDPEEDYD